MSRAASQTASSRSGGTKNSRASRSSYRRVAPTSQVDEALFGNTNTPSAARRQAAADVVSMEAIEKLIGGGGMPKTAAPDSTVISASDLARMRGAATFVSPEEMRATRAAEDQNKAQRMQKARERKERMMAAEAEAKSRTKKTASEKISIAKGNATLSKAKAKLDEELDDVKKMNQMMSYAKCVTIRDAQIGEKVEMEEELNGEEARLDAIMEIERVKAIQRAAEIEAAKAKTRRAGALVVVDQIKEREAQRELEMEQRDIEQQMMLKHIQKMEEDDHKALEQKVFKGRELLAQVLDSNQAQIEKKQEYKLLEAAEEEHRLQYLMEKEAKEAALRSESDRIKAEKEAETLRLRAAQEKMADTKAEEDALRAKRAQEASERDWRNKELSAARSAGEKQQAMKIARNVQMREKERKLAEQAQLEKLEFERICNVQAEADARDREEVETKVSKNIAHSNQLRGTIARNEVERKDQRKKFLSEGSHLVGRVGAEQAKVNAIKERKLAELESMGVPDKYTAELRRYKPVAGA